MPPDVNAILRDVLVREGGEAYTDNPDDRGGPTKYGITQATLSAWRKTPQSADDVKALTEGEALDIYRAEYAKPFLVLPDPLVPIMVDMAVNHGPVRAIKLLQRAVGVAEDGVLGTETRDMVQKLSARRVCAAVVAERQIFYARIVVLEPNQLKFLVGWTNRNAEFIRELAG